MNINDLTDPAQGGPAFPTPPDSFGPNGEVARPFYGMTLRDWLAGMVLQGIHASCSKGYPSPENVAIEAYRAADAMLQQRDKP